MPALRKFIVRGTITILIMVGLFMSFLAATQITRSATIRTLSEQQSPSGKYLATITFWSDYGMIGNPLGRGYRLCVHVGNNPYGLNQIVDMSVYPSEDEQVPESDSSSQILWSDDDRSVTFIFRGRKITVDIPK
jgi:hypothetical protein